MTSKKQECFVYMTLPGQTDQITAGKYVLEKTEQGIDVGHFVYTTITGTKIQYLTQIEVKVT